jgi:phosphotransferase system HPr (HPr) family protein
MEGCSKNSREQGEILMIQQSKVLSKGLHTQSITQLVQVASRYRSDMYLIYKGRRVNAKSMLGVLSLGISNQADITVEADGNDEQEAIDQVLKTLESFNSTPENF